MSSIRPSDDAPAPAGGPPPPSSPPRRRGLVGILLWAAVGLTLAAVFAVAILVPKPAEKKVEKVQKSVPVHTVSARADGFTDILELPGKVEPRVAATLAAEKPGRIMSVEVDRGDRVRAGQVVVKLDGEAWEARLRQAEVEQRDAAREFARVEDLKKTGAVSQSGLDAAEARRDRAAAALADARVQVRQCQVVSPVDGEVTDRFVEAGEHAAEGGPVIRVVDISTVKVVFDLPERVVSELKTGRPVTFTVDGLGAASRTADVSFVSAEADPRSNTYRVEARLPNPGGVLRAGMIARVRVERPVAPGHVAVPLAAIIPRRGEHIVFVAAGGRAIRRTVTLDRIAGGMAVLSAGVAAGEQVISDGHRGLIDGVAIEVSAGEAPAAPGTGS